MTCFYSAGGEATTLSENAIRAHPDFRMIVLANRPGFPFLGNDFFGSLGKSFFSQTEDLSLQLFCRLLSGSPFTCVPSLWRWWRTAQQVSNFKIIEVPRFSSLLNVIFNTTRLTILLRHKLWISVLFPRVFCWQQVLTLILIGLFCLVPLSDTACLKYLSRVLIGLFSSLWRS